jgi:hypothetical protein
MKKLKDLIEELKLLEASGFGDYEIESYPVYPIKK